jgi:hypothetical protein
MVDVALLWIVGMIAAVPLIFWWARDLGRIPSRTWMWTGHHRSPWQWGVLLGWFAGGWPAIVVLVAWSRSQTRCDLYDELSDREDRRTEVSSSNE